MSKNVGCRAVFRQYWSLDPAITFLNHGSYGACPVQLLEYQRALQDRMERQPVQFLKRDLEGMIAENLAAIANLLGASTDLCAFIPNTTFGINSIFNSIPITPHDLVVYLDHEYNATVNIINYHAARRGFKTHCISLPLPLSGPKEVVEILAEQMPENATMLVFDALTSFTAIKMPLELIVNFCRDRNILTLIDGAHAPGQMPINLTQLAPSFFVGNCHKWLCTPKGAAVIYVDPKYVDNVSSSVISHAYNSKRTKDSISPFHEQFFWPGTFDPTPWLCVKESLQWFERVIEGGIYAAMRHNHDLVVKMRRYLCEARGYELLVPDEMLGAMASFFTRELYPLKTWERDAADGPLQERLLKEFGIEIPEIPWSKKEGRLLRISCQLYNQPADYQRLLEALEALRV